MTDQPPASPRKATGRSKVGNAQARGRAVLPDVPWRSGWMRYFRDEYSDLLQHMGGPDAPYCTSPRQALARRAALL